MRDPQNSEIQNKLPSPTQDDEPSREKPPPNSYYYDDATGYEIYREGSENEEEDAERSDEKSANLSRATRLLVCARKCMSLAQCFIESDRH
jgi:hypothetical protein